MAIKEETSRSSEASDSTADHAEVTPEESGAIVQKLTKTAFELLPVEPPMTKGGGVSARTLYHQPGGGTAPDTD